MSSPVILVVEDESTKESEIEKPVEYKPDEGYAWVIVFCSFIVHFFALGIAYK